MVTTARNYKPSTLKKLFMLSSAKCANPSCTNSLLGPDENTIISQIVHIEAANPGGPRYNPKMNDDQRRSFDNLMLLCLQCHAIVDNPLNVDKYTVEKLKQWKEIHENKQKAIRLKDLSLLRSAINALAEKLPDSTMNLDKSIDAFDPKEKITYNAIKRNKNLIEDYKIYYSKINSIYSELEKQGSFKKEKLLRNINAIYLKVLGKYVKDSSNKLEVIKNNADNIFDDVEEELLKLSSEESKDNYFEILVIMVDAFIRCKIMEKPN